MYRRKGEKIMKRRYERPSAYIEEFTPNEYVAACGDSGKVYMFRCDAGGGYSGTVWLETNGEPGLQKKGRWEGWGEYHPGDEKLGGYHACGTTHEANSTDKFLDCREAITPVLHKAEYSSLLPLRKVGVRR